MKSVKAAAIFAVLAVITIALAAVPVSAGERQYVELGKTYTIQGGWGSGYLIFQKYVLVNASDNVSVNWKTGTKGDMSNYWQLSINTYSPAMNWSSNMTENNVLYQFQSSQGGLPLSLWVRPSVNAMIEVRIATFGNFGDQTLNITVNRTAATGTNYQGQIDALKAETDLLKAQLGALNTTINGMNSTLKALQAQVSALSTNLSALESRVEDLEALQNQIALLNALYTALQENMTQMQDFIDSLNVTGDNVTVVYQNITKRYENITNLTTQTTENVTKTIWLFQNTTKTINAYDNKTLGALATNLTKANEALKDLGNALNGTAGIGDVQDLEKELGGVKNTTAKRSAINNLKNEETYGRAVLGGLFTANLVLFGYLHSKNKGKINEHDAYIGALVNTLRPEDKPETKPAPKPEVKKAAAKKVENENIDETLRKLEAAENYIDAKTLDEELEEEED